MVVEIINNFPSTYTPNCCQNFVGAHYLHRSDNINKRIIYRTKIIKATSGRRT